MGMTPTVLAIGVTVLLGLTACGDAGGGGGDYAEAIADSIRAEEDLPFDDDQVDCIAAGMVEAIGEDRLAEEGTPDEVAALDGLQGLDLDDDQLRAIGDGIVACGIDFGEIVAASTDQAIPDELIECITDNVDDDALGEVLGNAVAGSGDFQQSEEFVVLIGGLLEACPDLATAGG